ncbi:hypothetical protein PPACK8108_LOCUS6305 [Phakopsora pachyrhizi]|uniref:Uncharacterized protein n=1 Tax=Phakopsora pachyrhizi TaxID=170000 RepID=A0AAV0AU80_PHAPC|nr:hypothetical protein PPACK8108_LOCUS6305 [Phakopsora pachyrhizi]
MTVLIDGKLEDPLNKDKKVSLLGGVICGQRISMGSVSEGSSCGVKYMVPKKPLWGKTYKEQKHNLRCYDESEAGWSFRGVEKSFEGIRVGIDFGPSQGCSQGLPLRGFFEAKEEGTQRYMPGVELSYDSSQRGFQGKKNLMPLGPVRRLRGRVSKKSARGLAVSVSKAASLASLLLEDKRERISRTKYWPGLVEKGFKRRWSGEEKINAKFDANEFTLKDDLAPAKSEWTEPSEYMHRSKALTMPQFEREMVKAFDAPRYKG